MDLLYISEGRYKHAFSTPSPALPLSPLAIWSFTIRPYTFVCTRLSFAVEHFIIHPWFKTILIAFRLHSLTFLRIGNEISLFYSVSLHRSAKPNWHSSLLSRHVARLHCRQRGRYPPISFAAMRANKFLRFSECPIAGISNLERVNADDPTLNDGGLDGFSQGKNYSCYMPLYRIFILPSGRLSPSGCHHLHEDTQGNDQ